MKKIVRAEKMLTGYKVYIPKSFAEILFNEDTVFLQLEIEDGDTSISVTPVLKKDIKVYETTR